MYQKTRFTVKNDRIIKSNGEKDGKLTIQTSNQRKLVI